MKKLCIKVLEKQEGAHLFTMLKLLTLTNLVTNKKLTAILKNDEILMYLYMSGAGERIEKKSETEGLNFFRNNNRRIDKLTHDMDQKTHWMASDEPPSAQTANPSCPIGISPLRS